MDDPTLVQVQVALIGLGGLKKKKTNQGQDAAPAGEEAVSRRGLGGDVGGSRRRGRGREGSPLCMLACLAA